MGTNNFTEQGFVYDKNGNIKAMKRYGETGLDMDVTCGHSGNRLSYINQTLAYDYDSNGNMNKDYQRSLDIEYNLLNLPYRITKNDTLEATYAYLADGTKTSVARTETYECGISRTGETFFCTTTSGFHYLGSLVYKLSENVKTLESTSFGGGRIEKTSNSYEVNYFITDHLGSTRAIVNQNGEITGTNNYYPFGKLWEGNVQAPTTRYTFSGKEKQTTGDINYFDFGARMLSNEGLPVWTTQDPMQEKYYSWSSYNYCMNNPLKYVDPFGMELRNSNNSDEDEMERIKFNITTIASPIFDRDGNLLGTDDEGLQGEPIVMDEKKFTQGMSHSKALRLNLGVGGLKSGEAISRFHKTLIDLPNRPDWDGYLTKEEADKWWNEKSGEPLYVDQSKIYLSGITTKSFGNKQGAFIYKNFIWSLNNTGKVYGTLRITLVDAKTGVVYIGGTTYLDEYDFKMDGRAFRDFATWFGRPGGANDGKDYKIIGYGQAKIPVKK